MNARELVVAILHDFDAGAGNLDGLIDRYFISARIDHRDKRFVFEMVYGILRNRRAIDFVIEHFLEDKDAKKNLALMNILRMGAYQIIYLDRVPDHASVNESVKIAKSRRTTAHCAGLVNALLRNIIKNKKRLPAPTGSSLAERLSIEYSHPLWLVERWLTRLGLSHAKKLLAFNNTRPETVLRRRIRGLSKQQFETEVRTLCKGPVGFMNLFYPVSKSVQSDRIIVLGRGDCVVQSPSSGWAVAMADIQQGDHLLDVCCAPGGKTTLMAELAGQTGTVCACDISFSRLAALIETAERMDLRTIFPFVADGRQLPVRGYFDKILVDAPCSGTGIFNHHPDARWTRTAESLTAMAGTQRELLIAAAQSVPADGILVYSTCSIEPEENEQIVQAFLESHPDFVLEKPPSSIPANFTDLQGFLRITPYQHGQDGMFAARMKRKAQKT